MLLNPCSNSLLIFIHSAQDPTTEIWQPESTFFFFFLISIFSEGGKSMMRAIQNIRVFRPRCPSPGKGFWQQTKSRLSKPVYKKSTTRRGNRQQSMLAFFITSSKALSQKNVVTESIVTECVLNPRSPRSQRKYQGPIQHLQTMPERNNKFCTLDGIQVLDL